MNKILIILRHEFLSVVKRRGFWISLIMVPLFSGIVTAISVVGSTAAVAATAANKASQPAKPQGFVDASGVLNAMTPSANFLRYPNEDAARAALQEKKIEGYYSLPADFLGSGKVTFVSDQFSPIESLQKTGAFENMVNTALLSADPQAQKRFDKPITLQTSQALAPADTKGSAGDMPFSFAPVVATVLFFITLMTASTYLMNGVTGEKENRVMEILMSSVSPRQLLMGKILGLSLVGLMQLGLWLLSLLSVARFVTFLPPQIFSGINLGVILLGLVFYVMGYFIYASALAGLGALMPGQREAAQYTFFVILPAVLPMYFMSVFMSDPNGGVATALSLFPLTAPVAMVARLSAADVPMWQVALSAALTFATMWVVIAAVTRIFRAQTLLSGTKPTLKQVFAALR